MKINYHHDEVNFQAMRVLLTELRVGKRKRIFAFIFIYKLANEL
jgi:hypothetical protein